MKFLDSPLIPPQIRNSGPAISFCLAGAVFIISGLFSSVTLDPVLLPRFLALSVIVLGLMFMIMVQAARSRASYDFSIIHKTIFPAFICYLAISGLSLINASNLAEGLFEWLKLLVFTVFLYSAALIISKNKSGVTILARGVILVATFLSVIGICQYYGLAFNSIPGNYIIYGTMAHKNLYASALFLMLPFALYGVCRFSHFWQMAGWVAIISMSSCIVLARARTVWAAIIVATVVLTVLFIIGRRESILMDWKNWLRFNRNKSAGVLLGLLTLTAAVGYYNDEILNAPPSAGEKRTSASQIDPFAESVWSLGTMNERLFLWEKSLAMAEANPLLGVGLGQWRMEFPAYAKKQLFKIYDNGSVEIFFRRPHNDFVWVLTESGIIGLLSYLAILGIVIFYAVKVFFKSDDADSRALAIFMLFGIVGYMVIAFFSFPKERIMHNIFLMLNLACIVSAYHRSFAAHGKVSYPKILTLNYLVILLLIISVIVGYIRLDSEVHVKNALAARHTGDWQTLRSEIDKADSLLYPLDPVAVPLAWYRGIANHSLGQFEKALEDFKKAYQIHPHHIHVLNNLGTGYAQTGDYENAARYYEKALDVWPDFVEARINLGVINFHLGDFAKARRHLMRLDRNHEDTRVLVYLQFIENRLEEPFR